MYKGDFMNETFSNDAWLCRKIPTPKGIKRIPVNDTVDVIGYGFVSPDSGVCIEIEYKTETTSIKSVEWNPENKNHKRQIVTFQESVLFDSITIKE